MEWIVGYGAINFWKDRWWGEEKIGEGLNIDSSLPPLTVKEALQSNFRWENTCADQLSPGNQVAIKPMSQFICNKEDLCVWTPTYSG